MIIDQISVFAENKPGTLAEILAVLTEHGINMRALSVADTADFGILRLIVNEPAKTERILRGAGFPVKVSPVLTLSVTDQPGGLLTHIEKLGAAGINVEYLYAFASGSAQDARVVLKVDNPDRAMRVICEDESCPAEEDSQKGPTLYW